MNPPRISVVIPCYNDVGYLDETLRSVLNQDYPNLELIIMDGGSTDGSVDLIRKYEDGIAYWVSEPDGGPGPAVAKGLSMASGEILAWLCSNDLYLPGCLDEVAHTFKEDANVDLVYGFARWIDAEGRFLREDRTKVPNLHKAMLYAHWSPPQHSCFWRRRLYQQCQVDPAMRVSHDFDFFLRASAIARVRCIEKPLAVFRIHPRTEDFDTSGDIYIKKSWIRFIRDHKIPAWQVILGSIYWTLRVRYAIGGWRQVITGFRLRFWRALLRKNSKQKL